VRSRGEGCRGHGSHDDRRYRGQHPKSEPKLEQIALTVATHPTATAAAVNAPAAVDLRNNNGARNSATLGEQEALGFFVRASSAAAAYTTRLARVAQ